MNEKSSSTFLLTFRLYPRFPALILVHLRIPASVIEQIRSYRAKCQLQFKNMLHPLRIFFLRIAIQGSSQSRTYVGAKQAARHKLPVIHILRNIVSLLQALASSFTARPPVQPFEKCGLTLQLLHHHDLTFRQQAYPYVQSGQ
ncbi:hypothetical protein DFQ00_108191 [Paenibacillus barcinonensis]|uniref:Uncharacterized protein n=1 Tax=Paenibacillus barcinonensis TaxID=198119 RepID=A0A2V4VI15_PAEBA|nr:hypothetical protein DFQ00_108191 [Paenibacillus barcinonensis]